VRASASAARPQARAAATRHRWWRPERVRGEPEVAGQKQARGRGRGRGRHRHGRRRGEEIDKAKDGIELEYRAGARLHKSWRRALATSIVTQEQSQTEVSTLGTP
jgi:hypothetical protein